MEKRRRRYIRRTVYAVKTDYHNSGEDVSFYNHEEDAIYKAAQLCHALYADQRNFEEADKAKHRELWAVRDYKGVLEHWGEVMSEAMDHQDYIQVVEAHSRVRLSLRGAWGYQAGAQDPFKVYLKGVPTLRRSATLGEEAVRLYADRTGITFEGDEETAIADLLADLRHLCNRDGLRFEELVERSQSYYSEEINGVT